MSMDQKPHVLLLYRTMIPSLILCGDSQLRELDAADKLVYRDVKLSAVRDDDLNWADAVLLGRSDSQTELRIAQVLKDAGKYLIYMIDDDILNIPQGLSCSAFYSLAQTKICVGKMLELCDAVLSPSVVLLEKYAVGKKAIHIEEPALCIQEGGRRDANSPITIGFAGSLDRTADLDTILGDTLRRIAKKYNARVRFEFFGAIPSFAKELNAVAIPYCNSYSTYLKTLGMRNWDIGLAPMPDTPFHRCKHYIKYIEYAALGIAGVFSNVMPYTQLREKGWFAIYCENTTAEWEAALCSLIDDREALKQARMHQSDVIRRCLTVDRVAEQLLLEAPELLKIRTCKKKIKLHACNLRFSMLKDRMITCFQVYSWRVPFVLIKRIIERLCCAMNTGGKVNGKDKC